MSDGLLFKIVTSSKIVWIVGVILLVALIMVILNRVIYFPKSCVYYDERICLSSLRVGCGICEITDGWKNEYITVDIRGCSREILSDYLSPSLAKDPDANCTTIYKCGELKDFCRWYGFNVSDV